MQSEQAGTKGQARVIPLGEGPGRVTLLETGQGVLASAEGGAGRLGSVGTKSLSGD